MLAVDADPNTCLDIALGVKVEHTVGGVREEAKVLASEGTTTGVAKQELMRVKIAQSLVESSDFDLIAMGRPEGPGCYCFANNALRAALKEIADDYPYVVLDNEAGLENLSRRIVRELDLMIMVADPSRQGLETVRRLSALAREMKIKVKQLALVINRSRRETLPPLAAALQAETGAALVTCLADDEDLRQPFRKWRVPPDPAAIQSVVAGIDRLLFDAGVPTLGRKNYMSQATTPAKRPPFAPGRRKTGCAMRRPSRC